MKLKRKKLKYQKLQFDHRSKFFYLIIVKNIFILKSIRLTKAVCIDCEMVGIGEMGLDNMLARVSIVNQLGQCLYDKYVKPTEPVVDYRTSISGITEENLQNGLI